MGAFVSGLATTPVKSTRIGAVGRIELDASGARGDRAFCVIGPWVEALSQYIGAPLRLVEPEVGVDRGAGGAISIVSRASLTDLATVAHTDSVDARRFRMLIEIDGVTPYEEDSWVGHELAVGDARVAIRGNVGRCAVTTRDPDSAQVNFPTLKLLAGYRGEVETTEPLPFGIYGEVLAPGTVTVGDPVALRR